MSLQYLSHTSPRQVAHQLSDMGIQQSVVDLFIFAKSGYSTSRKWQSQDLHLGSWPRAELQLAVLGCLAPHALPKVFGASREARAFACFAVVFVLFHLGL